MNRASLFRGSIARPWLVAAASLAAMACLACLLWKSSVSNPHEQQAEELVLYCAAGLLKPVQEVCDNYQRECGVNVRIEPDSSGKLLSKIRIAPDRGDLYLAGEESYVREARRLRLVAEMLPVARQHVVLAVLPGNPRKIAAVDDLLGKDVRVVLANPEVAAVGRAAQKALAGAGQWEALLAQTRKLGSKVSLVGTVTEAAQAVKIGAADAAMVWDATARQFALEAVEVPAFQEHATEQVTLGVLASAARPAAALRLARYLTARDRGQPVFQKHFLQPIDDADRWDERPAAVLMAGAMLQPAIDELVGSFNRREGVTVRAEYAECGEQVARLKALKSGSQEGRRFPDAYFASDESLLGQVQPWFEAATAVSRNDMLLAVEKGNPKKVGSIGDLTRADLRIGLAHPAKPVLGTMTDDLLKRLGLHDKIYAADRRRPVVQGDSGRSLVEQMLAGSLDVALVFRSDVSGDRENAGNRGEIVALSLPEAAAVQPYAVARDSGHKHLMRRLLEAILSPSSEQHFLALGLHWVARGESP